MRTMRWTKNPTQIDTKLSKSDLSIRIPIGMGAISTYCVKVEEQMLDVKRKESSMAAMLEKAEKVPSYREPYRI